MNTYIRILTIVFISWRRATGPSRARKYKKKYACSEIVGEIIFGLVADNDDRPGRRSVKFIRKTRPETITLNVVGCIIIPKKKKTTLGEVFQAGNGGGGANLSIREILFLLLR